MRYCDKEPCAILGRCCCACYHCGRWCGVCGGIPLSAFRPIEEAIVTSGGIEVKEISPKTMESKIKSGLYFAGEVIDVDAYTGGFNLQIAYSTGYLAGKSAAESCY